MWSSFTIEISQPRTNAFSAQKDDTDAAADKCPAPALAPAFHRFHGTPLTINTHGNDSLIIKRLASLAQANCMHKSPPPRLGYLPFCGCENARESADLVGSQHFLSIRFWICRRPQRAVALVSSVSPVWLKSPRPKSVISNRAVSRPLLASYPVPAAASHHRKIGELWQTNAEGLRNGMSLSIT